jgi:hypothetical protein
MTRHRFAFTPSYRAAALPFGVTPRTAYVEVADARLRVHFGPWRLDTQLSNIKDTQITDGYSFLRTAGPAHLSFTDRGVTFATGPGPGLCVCFHEPVKAIDWVGVLKHPGATMTVEDPETLRAELTA